MTMALTVTAPDLRISARNGPPGEVLLNVSHGTRLHEFRFSGDRGVLTPASEAGTVAGLFPAMRLGAPMQVGGPISPLLSRSLTTIQEIYRLWDPSARVVPVRTPEGVPPAAPTADGTAAFFSGGVDSFYTALKHRDAITALVYVRGFDVPLGDAPAAADISDGLHAAARALGRPLIEITTDVRAFSDGTVAWGMYHGAAMAAVAHLLSGRFGRMLIPASHSYADLFPWGSHPLLDPLWSSERMEIVHDGAEATRPEKIRRLASDETAMGWLRVCWESRGSAYNCGRCEKCTRTMAALRMAGALERCRTMPSDLDLSRVRSLVFTDESTRSFWVEIADGARASGDHALALAADQALRARPRTSSSRRFGPRRIALGLARRARRLRGRETR